MFTRVEFAPGEVATLQPLDELRSLLSRGQHKISGGNDVGAFLSSNAQTG